MFSSVWPREGTTLSLQFCKWYSLVSEAHCASAGDCQLVCTTNTRRRRENDGWGSGGKSKWQNHLLPVAPTLNICKVCKWNIKYLSNITSMWSAAFGSVYSGIAVLAAVVKAVIPSRPIAVLGLDFGDLFGWTLYIQRVRFRCCWSIFQLFAAPGLTGDSFLSPIVVALLRCVCQRLHFTMKWCFIVKVSPTIWTRCPTFDKSVDVIFYLKINWTDLQRGIYADENGPWNDSGMCPHHFVRRGGV